ncbi:hypothetical protein C21_03192 [Arenibacter sp. NBRC 103722]|nr:hypothetical protein C21_03192 [Arenibacter sp. NBRC 103722]
MVRLLKLGKITYVKFFAIGEVAGFDFLFTSTSLIISKLEPKPKI